VFAIAPVRQPGVPPIRLLLALLAQPFDRYGGVLPAGSARSAEAPPLLHRALAAVDEVVEVERVEVRALTRFPPAYLSADQIPNAQVSFR
jgi:hypothetical protein